MYASANHRYVKTWLGSRKEKHDTFLAGKCQNISSENPAETQSWRHNWDWKSPDVSSEISNFVASDAAGKWPDVYLKTSSDLTLTNVETQSQSVVSGRAVTSPSFTRLPDVELSWYVNTILHECRCDWAVLIVHCWYLMPLHIKLSDTLTE